MTTVTIASNTLKAALTHAGDKDIRYYLNGVLVDTLAGRIVATDGNRMFVASGPKVDGGQQYILPRSLVATVCKAVGKKGADLTVTFAGSGETATATISLPDGRQFGETLIDGRFPDYARVIPTAISGEPGQYDTRYLEDAANALVIHGACASAQGVRVAYNGGSNACVVYAPGCTENLAFCVVMPIRADGDKIGPDLAAFMGMGK